MLEEEGNSGWSIRDQLGCLLLYLVFWLPFTLLGLGFAPSFTGFIAGLFQNASEGDLFSVAYILFSLPALVLPILMLRSLLRQEGE